MQELLLMVHLGQQATGKTVVQQGVLVTERETLQVGHHLQLDRVQSQKTRKLQHPNQSFVVFEAVA